MLLPGNSPAGSQVGYFSKEINFLKLKTEIII